MSFLLFNKSAAPSNPASGKAAIYADQTSGEPTYIDELGISGNMTYDGWRDRPLIYNGMFLYAQRQVPGTLTTYSSVGGRIYTADRWCVSNETASVQFAQVDTMGAIETGLGARYYGKFLKLTNAGKIWIGQPLEGNAIGHLRGTPVRFQCKMRYGVNPMTVRMGMIQLTAAGTVDSIPINAGTFLSAFGAVGTDPTLGTALAYLTPRLAETSGTVSGTALTCVLSNAWVRYSAVFDIPTDCKNLIPCIWTNGQPAANDTLLISECDMLDGVEVRHNFDPYANVLELLRCKKFYNKTFADATAPAQNAGVLGALRDQVAIAGAVTTSSVMQWRFPVQMRAAPSTVTFYNPSAANAYCRNVPAATDATATASASGTKDCIDINVTGLAGWTAGQELKVHCTVEAEL